jgi:5'-phosphate synthase pdxT subunit
MRIGVLALQGDFREHLHALKEIGVVGIPVKRQQNWKI